MGTLLMMGHAGAMTHADTVENLTLFARRSYRGSSSTSSRPQRRRRRSIRSIVMPAKAHGR
jgi:hypothetical protein